MKKKKVICIGEALIDRIRNKIVSADIGDDNKIVPVTKYFVSKKDFSKFKISFSINFLLRTSSAKHE